MLYYSGDEKKQEAPAHCCCPRLPGSYPTPLSALSEADTSSYASELTKLLPSSTDEEEPTLEEDVQEEGDVQEQEEEPVEEEQPQALSTPTQIHAAELHHRAVSPEIHGLSSPLILEPITSTHIPSDCETPTKEVDVTSQLSGSSGAITSQSTPKATPRINRKN